MAVEFNIKPEEAQDLIDKMMPMFEKLKKEVDELDWIGGRKVDSYLVNLIKLNEIKSKINAVKWILGQEPLDIPKYKFR